jgi:hypothetical protein
MYISTLLSRLMEFMSHSSKKPSSNLASEQWDIELQQLTKTAIGDAKPEPSQKSKPTYKTAKVSQYCRPMEQQLTDALTNW